VIGRAWNAAAGATRSTAAWIDFGVAVLVACVERLRAPAVEAVREPVLVAQAITVRAGEAFVTPMHFPGHTTRRVISPGATLAIAAAALAATLGAGSTVLSAHGPGVAALAGEPSFISLRAPVQGGGFHHDSAAVRTVVTIEAPASSAQAPVTRHPASVEVTASPTSAVELVAQVGPALGSEPEAAVSEAPVAELVAAGTPEATVEPVAPPQPVATESAHPAVLPAYAGVRYTADQVRSLALGAGWPAALVADLLDVAWCESRFHPDAAGPVALGLMQMMPFWFRVAGFDVADWSDPMINLRVALVAFENDLSQGREAWAAWSCKPTARPGG